MTSTYHGGASTSWNCSSTASGRLLNQIILKNVNEYNKNSYFLNVEFTLAVVTLDCKIKIKMHN